VVLTVCTVKRALRALESPAYEKARKKNPLLPEITDRASLENTFKLLPMSMLALRVSKADAHEGHDHAPPKKTKRTKGLWTVKIEQQQEAQDDMYYVWLWEGSQVKSKVIAVLVVIAIFIAVLYPLWPLVLRQGVYYLSWGMLMFLGLFFLMAIFRVILFAITWFVLPPGLWLFPNLWEDVSVLESFKPLWAWNEVIFRPTRTLKPSRC
jgi:translocation protein SEC62